MRDLIDLHGGEVSAFSEGEGKGSIFELWLPLQRTAAVMDTGEVTGATVPRSSD